jgi:hypothetical protein
MTKSLRSILFCAGLVACLASCRTGSTSTPTVAATDRIIPTRYKADRFFATAVLPRGDTAVLFLDTGTGSYVWDLYIPYLELTVKDTITNARGVKTGVTPFPSFRADASLPTAITQTSQGTGLLVYPIDWRAQNNFGAWIGRETQGQLGSNWFNGRVWTIDYPNRRLVLRGRSSANDGEPGREQPFNFPTDTAGRRIGHLGYVDVVIDGDTVAMLMDTGATVWLSSAALARVGDGGPSERSSTHIDNWLFVRLRERHPDWPIIERADLWWGLSLIRVPNVSVGGHEVGPTWFSVLAGGPATPPTQPPSAPAWMKRRGGTLGGSLLKHFVVTLDYPRGSVRFYKPGS